MTVPPFVRATYTNVESKCFILSFKYFIQHLFFYGTPATSTGVYFISYFISLFLFSYYLSAYHLIRLIVLIYWLRLCYLRQFEAMTLDSSIDFQALGRLGLTSGERFELYSTVAAVLHLGNVQFEESAEGSKGGSAVAPGSEASLRNAAGLLGVDPEELRQALVTKVMMTNRGGLKGTVIL